MCLLATQEMTLANWHDLDMDRTLTFLWPPDRPWMVSKSFSDPPVALEVEEH